MKIVIYIPQIITAIDSHNVDVTFDTPDGIKICKYRASLIEPGISSISDCSDAEYWNLTNPIDELREFDKGIGSLFYLNGFDANIVPTKIKTIGVFNESDELPIFEILFENPKSSVICAIDDQERLSIKSSNSLPEFYKSGEPEKALKEVLSKFQKAYISCKRRSQMSL